MRWILCGFVSLFSLGVAAGQEKPDDLVRAAMKAAGGAETLTRYPAGRVVGKGTMPIGGIETPFTFEQVYHVPGRFRTLIRCEVEGQPWELLQVVDGATAKQKINGRTVPLTEASVAELQRAVLVNEIAQLTTLTVDKRFTLKSDKTLKGPDVGGLLVQVRGYPEIRLAFDRKAGHLLRMAYKHTDPDSAKDLELEIVFSEFKEVSGLTKPMRSVVSRDGKKVAELLVEKYTPIEKLDADVFTLKE